MDGQVHSEDAVNHRKINLQHLQAFVVVGRTLSFTDAAKELEVSKSKISKLITEYEQLLGDVTLFERTTRRVTLTFVGSAHHRNVVRMLDYFHVIHTPFMTHRPSQIP